MVLIVGAALLIGLSLPSSPQQTTPPTDPAPLVRRLAATAQLAAQEYRIGIVGGRVASQAEVDEARLFLQEARRAAQALPAELSRDVLAEIDSVIRLVNRTAAPDSIDVRILRLTSTLSSRSGVSLDELPAQTPSLARGAEVYQANCASCHGTTGQGDGPAARGLEPKPTNLALAAARLMDQSPLDYYRRITIGAVGTAMPSFELRLPAQDRWAAALYSTLLRLPSPSGSIPPALQSFPVSGRMSFAGCCDGSTVSGTARIPRPFPARKQVAPAMKPRSSSKPPPGAFDLCQPMWSTRLRCLTGGGNRIIHAGKSRLYEHFKEVPWHR